MMLEDLFSYERKKISLTEERREKPETFSIDGVDLNLSNLDHALDTLLKRFFFNIVIARAIRDYPHSQALLFLKA